MTKITTETIVNAPLINTWNAYTDPKMIVGWAFASDDWECPYAENDLRTGGRFLTRMSAKDKSFAFDFTGTYTDILPMSRIVYIMDRDNTDDENRKCEVTFQELDTDKTRVTVTFDAENQNPLEMQKDGWQSILNNFKKHTETSA